MCALWKCRLPRMKKCKCERGREKCVPQLFFHGQEQKIYIQGGTKVCVCVCLVMGRVLTLVPRRGAKKGHGELSRRNWDALAVKTPGGSNPSYSARFFTQRKTSLDDDLALTKHSWNKIFAKMQREWFRRQRQVSLGAGKPLRPRPLLKEKHNWTAASFFSVNACIFLPHSFSSKVQVHLNIYARALIALCCFETKHMQKCSLKKCFKCGLKY